MRELADRFAKAVEFAKTVGRVTMTDEAAAAWESAYPQLSADRPGLLGAVTARAEAQVIRLALIFALLDQRDTIDTVHLGAAMAVGLTAMRAHILSSVTPLATRWQITF